MDDATEQVVQGMVQDLVKLMARFKEDVDVFTCPLTLKVFQDPVVASDGRTYERSAIQKWIERKGTSATSPTDGKTLLKSELYPNFILKQLMRHYPALQE